MGNAHSAGAGCKAASNPCLTVDLQAIFDELRSVDTQDSGLTTAEIASALTISPTTARKFIKTAQEAGLCDVTRKVLLDMSGRQTTVPAYIFRGEQ